jgi:hypothetical protein
MVVERRGGWHEYGYSPGPVTRARARDVTNMFVTYLFATNMFVIVKE